VSAIWLIDEHWLLRGEQKVEFLTGDAADSPIVVDDVRSKTRGCSDIGFRRSRVRNAA
jgi:outer membrane scaffolding protein for murein synthesis (MipA/OmpV family)